jgi:TolB-like protein
LRTFRFGDFELDASAYELRRGRRRVRLEPRPLELLLLLVERPRQLVSRVDIAERLWGDGVFVDVEAGVNTAIRKVRRALRDSTRQPAFVETVPGKGYRFIAAVTSGPGPDQVTLGVLPFANLSDDRAREHLADGLTEETIAALGQVGYEHLSVIGRTSTLQFKRTRSRRRRRPRVGADYLVEGSIRGGSDRLRVTSRLVRVQDQAQVWSASYDREPTDVLRLQRELGTLIADEIRVRLSPDRLARRQELKTRSAAANDLYRRGRQAWNQLNSARTRRAIDYFARTTELDLDYGLAGSESRKRRRR